MFSKEDLNNQDRIFVKTFFQFITFTLEIYTFVS